MEDEWIDWSNLPEITATVCDFVSDGWNSGRLEGWMDDWSHLPEFTASIWDFIRC